MDEGHIGDPSAKGENGGGGKRKGRGDTRGGLQRERKQSSAECRSVSWRCTGERSGEPAARGSPKRYVFCRRRRGARAEGREDPE